MCLSACHLTNQILPSFVINFGACLHLPTIIIYTDTQHNHIRATVCTQHHADDFFRSSALFISLSLPSLSLSHSLSSNPQRWHLWMRRWLCDHCQNHRYHPPLVTIPYCRADCVCHPSPPPPRTSSLQSFSSFHNFVCLMCRLGTSIGAGKLLLRSFHSNNSHIHLTSN